MSTRSSIDVARLPTSAFDTRAPVWWGNTLLLLIESMTVALLVASYFYLARHFSPFPPPRVDHDPPLFEPLPRLLASSVDLVAHVASAGAMLLADRAARRAEGRTVRLALLAAVLIGLVSLALRPAEMRGLHFGWDDNAYGSLVWGLLVLHTLYLVVAVAEALFAAVSIALYGLDEKLAVDATLTSAYWYWVSAVWLVVYLVVWWTPRIL